MSFITFEGIEGSGKSTQAALLARYLERKGRKVVAVREPGGTALGDRIRELLLQDRESGPSPMAELFLYEASRAQVVEEVIGPALGGGATIICDRFTDSTVAYQGYGRGLDIGTIEVANKAATSGLVPDLTFLIDLDPETGLRRALSRIAEEGGPREDRFEKETLDFHRRVREGYLAIARREPERVYVINGSGEIPSIHRQVCDIMEKKGF